MKYRHLSRKIIYTINLHNGRRSTHVSENIYHIILYPEMQPFKVGRIGHSIEAGSNRNLKSESLPIPAIILQLRFQGFLMT